MKNDTSFVKGRLKSFKFAAAGAYKLVVTEHSVMLQFFITCCITAAGFYFSISKTEWLLQTLAIGLVMSMEGINTAVEKIADFIHPDFHTAIGFIKDIAAGAVFFAALSAFVVGCIIYVPLILAL